MNIKDCRNNKGYTIEYVARLLDISNQHYINIENYKNKPNILLGLDLCTILNVSPYDIFKAEYYITINKY